MKQRALSHSMGTDERDWKEGRQSRDRTEHSERDGLRGCGVLRHCSDRRTVLAHAVLAVRCSTRGWGRRWPAVLAALRASQSREQRRRHKKSLGDVRSLYSSGTACEARSSRVRLDSSLHSVPRAPPPPPLREAQQTWQARV